jgi:ferritin
MKTNHVKLFEAYNSPETIERLSDNVLKLLNEQIKNELNSSQMYRAISCWMDKNEWVNGTKLFFKYADEELIHMNKIYNYIFEKNSLAKVPASDAFSFNNNKVKELLEESLNHEMEVTKNWNDIADQALKEKDNDTYALAQWFINEQREEEIKFRDIIFKIKKEMPDYEIDLLFGNLL